MSLLSLLMVASNKIEKSYVPLGTEKKDASVRITAVLM